MTPCERYKDYIFNLLDDELDIHRRGELENHLKSCSSCLHFLDRCRLLRRRLQNLAQISTSETFHLLLRERIRRELAGKRRRISFLPSPVVRGWIPAAAVVILLLTVGILLRDQEKSIFPSGRSGIVDTRIEGSPTGETVEYVADDYTGGLSLSRDDSKRNQTEDRDSLRLRPETQRVRPHSTPVSF